MTHRVLDRLEQFDEASREFSIRKRLVPDAPLRSFIWDASVWLDQGQEGACVGFSFGGKLSADPIDFPNITDDSAREIYNKAKTLDSIPGEDYSGTSVLAGAKAVKKLYPEIAKGYRWAFSLEDVIRTLGYVGPVVLGINWYQGMFEPNREGIIYTDGPIMGGHAIMARGVDVDNKLIRLRNSWGKNWGVQGDCFISFDSLDMLLRERGEACILL